MTGPLHSRLDDSLPHFSLGPGTSHMGDQSHTVVSGGPHVGKVPVGLWFHTVGEGEGGGGDWVPREDG